MQGHVDIVPASEVSEKPRPVVIDGSATFTIVVSRTIINVPPHKT